MQDVTITSCTLQISGLISFPNILLPLACCISSDNVYKPLSASIRDQWHAWADIPVMTTSHWHIFAQHHQFLPTRCTLDVAAGSTCQCGRTPEHIQPNLKIYSATSVHKHPKGKTIVLEHQEYLMPFSDWKRDWKCQPFYCQHLRRFPYFSQKIWNIKPCLRYHLTGIQFYCISNAALLQVLSYNILQWH